MTTLSGSALPSAIGLDRLEDKTDVTISVDEGVGLNPASTKEFYFVLAGNFKG